LFCPDGTGLITYGASGLHRWSIREDTDGQALCVAHGSGDALPRGLNGEAGITYSEELEHWDVRKAARAQAAEGDAKGALGWIDGLSKEKRVSALIGAAEGLAEKERRERKQGSRNGPPLVNHAITDAGLAHLADLRDDQRVGLVRGPRWIPRGLPLARAALPSGALGYGSLHPSFYGLRTIVVTLFLAALLRIKRPEHFKEYRPEDLGAVVGLDRAPEVKTVRRKFARLAAMGVVRATRRSGRPVPRHPSPPPPGCSGPGTCHIVKGLCQ
jgi:hypothetical protein